MKINKQIIHNLMIVTHEDNKHITHNLMIITHEDKLTNHTQPHDSYS